MCTSRRAAACCYRVYLGAVAYKWVSFVLHGSCCGSPLWDLRFYYNMGGWVHLAHAPIASYFSRLPRFDEFIIEESRVGLVSLVVGVEDDEF